MLYALFSIFIFPGFLFLSVFGLAAEFVDRKLHARLQNRVGPPWFQPLADFIKLIAKEDLLPEEAEPVMFKTLPLIALSSIVTAFIYIPVWKTASLFSFSGDLVVVIYLLTIPTLTFFLAGWYSTSLYSMIGSVRSLTQLFAYEVPLFMGILSPALLADTWSLSGLASFYGKHPLYCLFNIIGFGVSIIAIQGKLERIPFDIPEAETEIVGGTFTEYSGKLLAYFRMAIDIEMVVASSLLACVFLPFWFEQSAIVGFLIYVLKVLFIIGLLTLFRTVLARLRIDQMVAFCWKYLAPLALLQILINLIIKGVLLK